MAKKFDINTSQGRARRRAHPELFNPSTLLPHSKKFIEERRNVKRSKADKED